MIRAALRQSVSFIGLTVALGLPGTAGAGDWKITPSIEVREAVTDNVLLTPKNKKTDFLTTVAPGISVAGQGARVRFDADYQLKYDAYLRESSLNGFRHNLRSVGNIELLERSVFLEAGAFAGESPVLSRGQQSAIDRRLGGNNSQFYSYTLSPYWVSRLGSWANTEARYRFGQSFSESASRSSITTGVGSGFSDSTIHQLSGQVISGENFNKFTWGLSGNATETSGTSSRNYSSRLLNLNTGYIINRYVALIGDVGYERINSGGFSQQIDGVIWDAGFRLTPSERTKFELTYGDRYNGRRWSSQFNTAFDGGTSISFRYAESVENQALQALTNLGFLSRDPNTGALIDRRTGLPFNGRDPNFDQTDRTFLQKSASVSLQAVRERNTYIFTAQHTTRDSNIPDAQTTGGPREKVIAFTTVWDRQLTPVLNGTADFSFSDSRTDSGGAGKNRTIRGGLSLSYALNETLKATLGYVHLRKEVSGRQFFANEQLGTYDENVIFLTVRKSF